MPKAEWDEAADGSFGECDWDTGPYDYPIPDCIDDGLVHAIEESDKFWSQEIYTMLCGRTLDHAMIIAGLCKPVDCMLCLAEGA